jgi:hypothetical protein
MIARPSIKRKNIKTVSWCIFIVIGWTIKPILNFHDIFSTTPFYDVLQLERNESSYFYYAAIIRYIIHLQTYLSKSHQIRHVLSKYYQASQKVTINHPNRSTMRNIYTSLSKFQI